jgi:hypothetical protein
MKTTMRRGSVPVKSLAAASRLALLMAACEGQNDEAPHVRGFEKGLPDAALS